MMLNNSLFVLVILNMLSIKAVQQQFVGSTLEEFFSDEPDVGLVSSDPLTLDGNDGVIGLSEGSIAGKFVEDELRGREALLGFANDVEDEDEDFFGDAFLANPVQPPPLYAASVDASSSSSSSSLLQDAFQQDLTDIFN